MFSKIKTLKKLSGGLILAILTACGSVPGYNPQQEEPIPPRKLVSVDRDRYFEAVNDPADPCAVTNIDYVDKSKGIRQRVVDWDKIGERDTYTLSHKGREAMVEKFREEQRVCPKPSFARALGDSVPSLDNTTLHQYYAFTLFWFANDTIHVKAVQYKFNTDDAGKALLKPVMFNFSLWGSVLTTYYSYERYEGPVALPQVAYRIDEHRFFEVVPYQHMPCSWARLYYVDTEKGIRSNVVGFDTISRKYPFIIDAANEEYLVAPIVESSSGCQSGGISDMKCADGLPYSTDSGRTWKHNIPSISGNQVLITGDQIFLGVRGKANINDLQNGYVEDVWKKTDGSFPKPRKAPIDTYIRCSAE